MSEHIAYLCRRTFNHTSMDKELPESQLSKVTPRRVLLRVSKSYLPGIKTYKATVVVRSTLNEEDLANRLVKSGCSFRKDTLLTSFRMMVSEIYKATEDGYNVDFGLGRTELTTNGTFESEYEKFDPKKHTLTPKLRPSPRLHQVTSRIPAENIGLSTNVNRPHPQYISLAIEPRSFDDKEPYNTIPAGDHPHVSIYGTRMKLMGDQPEVGLTIRSLETGEEYFLTAKDLIINSSVRLCFTPVIPFTAGEWEAIICTQFNPSYRLYKKPRLAEMTFTVL